MRSREASGALRIKVAENNAIVEKDAIVEEDDDYGQVIVSLTVFSRSAIDGLSAFEWTDGLKNDGRRYDMGTIRFVEEGADLRRHALDGAVSSLIDLLSEVPREVLFDEETFVRLFVTLGRGAQTLSPALVRTIAAVNATVWIDS